MRRASALWVHKQPPPHPAGQSPESSSMSTLNGKSMKSRCSANRSSLTFLQTYLPLIHQQKNSVQPITMFDLLAMIGQIN
jgi:hypothetical protein